MSEPVWDVVVIGAGAAGLMAAIGAAERGRRMLLLEKNRKPGVKILMSGGTRCNITHATDNRGIVAAYGPPGPFLHSALAAFSVQDTLDFFAGRRRRHQGRGDRQDLPRQQQGRRRARCPAAPPAPLAERVLALEEPLLDCNRAAPGFASDHAAARSFDARRVILTTGGQSYPGSGTTGDGYRLLARLGHAIVPPRPALVPITVAVPWVAELRGITLPDAAVRSRRISARLFAGVGRCSSPISACRGRSFSM